MGKCCKSGVERKVQEPARTWIEHRRGAADRTQAGGFGPRQQVLGAGAVCAGRGGAEVVRCWYWKEEQRSAATGQ